MIRLLVSFSLISSVLLPSAAHARYVSNYAAWEKMPPELQEVYLIGVMDSWTRTSAPGEPSWMRVQRTGLNKCVREQKISSTSLVKLVNTHYESYAADWRISPASVLKDVLMGACLADVNEEREKAGLSPWERKSGQISRDN